MNIIFRAALIALILLSSSLVVAGHKIPCDVHDVHYNPIYADSHGYWSCPTPVPTIVPTAVPTVIPTAVPTILPTVIPTPELTATPTIMPTPSPTATPTEPTPEPIPTPAISYGDNYNGIEAGYLGVSAYSFGTSGCDRIRILQGQKPSPRNTKMQMVISKAYGYRNVTNMIKGCMARNFNMTPVRTGFFEVVI